ncbi:MAG: Holliday junction branch migration DNA helicase RuvB [Planctomycetota bacterium]
MPPLRPGDEAEVRLDLTLRPQAFGDFVGQRKVVEKLHVFVEAALQRGETLDHVLLAGLPGLGKTTLAHLIATRLGAELRATSGPMIERSGDLAGILTSLKRGDVLFIDEIHRLPAAVEEYLYSAMEDYKIQIVIDQGVHARTVELSLQRFTLIGATTREGLLTSPFRARFGIFERLDPYDVADLSTIVLRSAALLGVEIVPDAAQMIARRSRGTPRVANRYLARLRDVAQVRAGNRISAKGAVEGFALLEVDEAGLETLHRRILGALVGAGGQPVGLKTLAVSVGEEEETIEVVYEPYLIQEGFIQKTPRGRKATEKAFLHLGADPKGAQPQLF